MFQHHRITQNKSIPMWLGSIHTRCTSSVHLELIYSEKVAQANRLVSSEVCIRCSVKLIENCEKFLSSESLEYLCWKFTVVVTMHHSGGSRGEWRDVSPPTPRLKVGMAFIVIWDANWRFLHVFHFLLWLARKNSLCCSPNCVAQLSVCHGWWNM